MDFKDIKRLVNLVETAGISELSIDEEGVKIEIKKNLTSNMTASPSAHYIYSQNNEPQQSASAPATIDTAPVVDANAGLTPIKAEMVGTFYGSPNPESPAFVKVGDQIEVGKVVCIVEAMKLFNEIESEISGTVEKICVANGDPIEYGQTLFLVRQ